MNKVVVKVEVALGVVVVVMVKVVAVVVVKKVVGVVNSQEVWVASNATIVRGMVTKNTSVEIRDEQDGEQNSYALKVEEEESKLF